MSNQMLQNNQMDQSALISAKYNEFRALYKEMTGKSETISRADYRCFVVELEQFMQLDLMLAQYLSLHHIVDKNSNVEIIHKDGNDLVYSSFDMFLSGYNQAYLFLTKEIEINYNVVMLDPSTSKLKEYVINIRLASGMVVHDGSVPDFMSFFPDMKLINYSYKINYVDYIVGNALANVVEGWVQSLKLVPENKMLKF